MMKAIVFSRVSTMIQDLEQQEQVLLQTARADGFKDEDIISISEHESAVKNDISERLGLSKAKQAIETQDVKVIYAFELSRIARRLDVFYDFRKFLIDHKVQLKIVNPKVQLLTEDGEIDENFSLVFSIFASLAEQEARLMQARFKRGKQKLREQNLFTGGKVCFGYTVNKDKEFVINEEERDIVVRIFKMYETMTISDIAKELVLDGTFNQNINSVQTMVRTILHREFYTGVETDNDGYRKSLRKYKFPAIISKETFDAAQEKLKERKKYAKTKSKHSYLCRGLVHNINGDYLKPMHCHGCYASWKITNTNWETLSVRIDLLDSIVFHYALENKKRKPGKDLMKYKVELQEELKAVSKKVSGINKKIQEEQDKIIKFEMRYASGKMTEETLDLLIGKVQETIKVFEADRSTLEADREDLNRRLSNLSKSGKSPLLGRISDLSIDEKIKIVHEEIQNVIVIKGKKRCEYVLGIQYFSGDYVMVDVNTISKKVKDEDGNTVEYEKTS